MPLSLTALEIWLRTFGPLRPEAWEGIVGAVVKRVYGMGKAVALAPGGMIYVGEGLLKQYARAGRTQPDIIRFLQAGEVLLVPYEADNSYVKTLERSVLYYWDEYALRQIMIAYPELLKIYMKLRDRQEMLLDLKIRLMGEELRNKLPLFDRYYPNLRPFLKNKDLANYLQVHESTLSRSKKTR